VEFHALDVETANPDLSTICQIGIAKFKDGRVIDEWVTLVNPDAKFHPMNINVHGIEAAHVKDAPRIRDLVATLRNLLEGSTIVTHTAFDRAAMRQAFERIELPEINCTWLDSARAVRRAWDEFSQSGYGLKNICAHIEYEFNHHDALEDAKAAGHVFLAASERTGLDLDGWAKSFAKKGGAKRWAALSVAREGDPDGPLFGETIVFTGSLAISRIEAADLAAKLGCSVGKSVTKKTSLLCVGDQDLSLLAGHKKSSKQRRAEELIAQGQNLRLLGESDFQAMFNLSENCKIT